MRIRSYIESYIGAPVRGGENNGLDARPGGNVADNLIQRDSGSGGEESDQFGGC